MGFTSFNFSSEGKGEIKCKTWLKLLISPRRAASWYPRATSPTAAIATTVLSQIKQQADHLNRVDNPRWLSYQRPRGLALSFLCPQQTASGACRSLGLHP